MVLEKETIFDDHGERKHQKYSPSMMERLVHCTPSLFLGWDLPAKKDTSYSKDGNTAHKLVEVWTEDRLKGMKFRYVDREKFTAEMRKHAKGYAKYVEKVIKPFLKYKHVWFIEQEMLIRENVGGLPDFVFIYKDEQGGIHLIIIDFKYGENVLVGSTRNLQLIGYAWCAIEHFGIGDRLVDAELHVYQPRTGHDTPPEKFTPAELQAEFEIIDAAIELSETWFHEGEIPFEDLQKYQRPGKWCQFCKLAQNRICKPYLDGKAEQTREQFVQIQKQKPKLKRVNNKYRLEDPGLLDPELIAWFALNKSELTKIAEGCAHAAMALIMKGHAFPGIKVIETDGQRGFIKNEKRVIAELIARGIPEDVVLRTEQKRISMSDAEAWLGKGSIDDLLARSSEPSYKLVSIEHEAEGVSFGLQTKNLFQQVANKKRK